MIGHTGVEKKLWEHRWAVALFVAAVLAVVTAGVVLSGKPAQALACDPTIQDCTGGGTQTHIVNTLTASAPQHGTITTSDGGINCGVDCTEDYNYIIFCDVNGDCSTPTYDTVTLTPHPATGYSLGDWSGDCSGTGPCSVIMDANRSVGAQFVDVAVPTVSLTSPLNNTKVGAGFTATATASDNSGSVQKVEFLVDGSLQGTDTSAPYSASINTSGLSDGSHTVSAKATDVNGLQSTSSRTVIVDLTSPTATGKPTGTRVSPTANVTATFSEAMNGASVGATDANGLPTTFTLKKKGTTKTLAATVVYSEPTASTFKATLDPTRKLRAGATYIATVSSAATDLVGNPLVAKTWKFTVKS
ncbi:MAG TPA: Ig-like domain-containing protein [Rubrobacter sp.]|nr:Ig-like domain-containing protein [Rubrobacter sp.]